MPSLTSWVVPYQTGQTSLSLPTPSGGKTRAVSAKTAPTTAGAVSECLMAWALLEHQLSASRVGRPSASAIHATIRGNAAIAAEGRSALCPSPDDLPLLG